MNVFKGSGYKKDDEEGKINVCKEIMYLFSINNNSSWRTIPQSGEKHCFAGGEYFNAITDYT